MMGASIFITVHPQYSHPQKEILLVASLLSKNDQAPYLVDIATLRRSPFPQC